MYMCTKELVPLLCLKRNESYPRRMASGSHDQDSANTHRVDRATLPHKRSTRSFIHERRTIFILPMAIPIWQHRKRIGIFWQDPREHFRAAVAPDFRAA